MHKNHFLLLHPIPVNVFAKPWFFIFLTLLSALPVFAQPAMPEALPASSPYGEAIVKRNISYAANPTPRQNFDLYLPKNSRGRLVPFIVWIHGGAWISGIKDWDNVKYLVRHGYAIASIDYRIAPEDHFPAQIQDCNLALNFILAHAVDYGLNPKEFIVGGGSAGGHLALLLGLARHQRAFGADASIKPLAILDFFGYTDLNQAMNDLQAIHSEKGIGLFKDAGFKLLGTPVEQSTDKLTMASPINYVQADNPPVLILGGDKDDLVPVAQGRRLQAALDAQGIKNQLIVLGDAGHDGPLYSTPKVESQVLGFLSEIIPKPVDEPVKNQNP
jgi:acetyl esterase/lipase